MSTGYSGTPLASKLGFKPGMRTAWQDPPEDFAQLLGPLPDGVEIVAGLQAPLDLAVSFVSERAELRRRLPALRAAIAPDGMAWIAWPKRASGVATDVTEDVVREEALPLGLVDTKVCAIDATWSGLRLVVRRALRG